ncbi:MAG: helix-turn-helix domain-containing protein [Verrucomicrobia bacterium]|nr:helix-turn-helix domain-containing protein [Verrucomicrobiota bacterium]
MSLLLSSAPAAPRRRPVRSPRTAPAASRHHSSMLRGVEALLVLLKAHRSLGITQLAAALQLSKSTTHDLAAALSTLGFVDQHPTTRRYAVSPEIFRFLHLVSTEYGPNSAVKPLLRTEARRLKATLVITALCRESTYALCASGADADTFLLGDNGPAYTSACGKVLVAQLPESEWPRFAPKPDDRTGSPYSNLDPARFYAELRAARVNGHACNLRERDPALCSVAAPICVGEAPWTRAIGLALPYSEWVVRDREELAATAKRVAAEIARLLVG